MGLLDFDDNEIMKGRRMPRDRFWRERRKLENNFEELQLLGSKKQSQDFEDSKFADRQPKRDHECEADMHGNCYQCNRKMI